MNTRAFRKNKSGTAWLFVVFVLSVAFCQPVEAVTNSLIIDNGNWNTAGSWSLGNVPTGADTVLITASNTVKVTTAPLNAYTGDLIIESNATLDHASSDRLENCMPSATGRVFLYDGALIKGNRFANDGQTTTVSNDFILSGDSAFTRSGYNVQVYLTGVWSGTGGVTFNCRTYNSRANDTYNFTGSSPNTYTGGTILQPVSGVGNFFYANADGCFGTGDVTVNPGVELRLNGSTSDTIDDTATLFINNGGKINLYGNNETVGGLMVDGTPVVNGTYGAPDNVAVDYPFSWIAGSGVLTVTNSPADVTLPTLSSTVENDYGGPVWLDNAPFVFTVSFSEDIDTNTLDAADFENGGTSGALTIGSITKTTVYPEPAVFDVEVTPASAGTLRLDIASGAVIKDFSSNAMDTASSIAGTDTLDVYLGAAQDTTISGTAGASDSWNDAANWDWGLPSGNQNAIVASNIVAQVRNTDTPAYSGSLTLQAGATLVASADLRQGSDLASSTNAFSGSAIIMNENSVLSIAFYQISNIYLPPIMLNGDATVKAGGNWADHSSRHFDGAISGTGQLNFMGGNNMTYNLNVAHSFSGGLLADGGINWRVDAEATGCLGTGDVTIGDTVTLRINVDDAMDDSGRLYLVGTGDAKLPSPYYKLYMNANDQIYELWIDGVQQPDGEYTSSETWITGTGVLTVKGPPAGTVIIVQ